MKWTIAKRIRIGLIFILIQAVAINIFAYYKLSKIESSEAKLTEESNPKVKLIMKVRLETEVNRSLLLRHVTETEKSTMESIERQLTEATSKNTEFLAEFGKKATDKDKSVLSTFTDYRKQISDYRKQILAASSSGNKAEAARMLDSIDQVYRKYFETLDSLVATIDQENQTLSKNIHSDAVTSKHTQIIGIVLALILQVGIGFWITNFVDRRLTEIATDLGTGSDKVSTSAEEVSTASQHLAEGSSEQASSLEETSASLEEMSSIIKTNTDNAQNSKDLANQTRNITEKNFNYMHELKAAVDSVLASSGEMTTAMSAIKNSSDSISKVIKTIDEIAFQTNILALNAAVEAARAGEAGMGFAVVADEVRNLAKRSADAAKETASMIEEAITNSERGVKVNQLVDEKLDDITKKADMVERGLQEILSQVAKVDEAMGQIAVASKEQSQGISQVNIALSQMDKVTQANAQTAQESATASASLHNQASDLRFVVERLHDLLGHAHHNIEVHHIEAPALKKRESHRKTALASVRKAASPLPQALTLQPRNGKETVTAVDGEKSLDDFFKDVS